jgi:DNA polymerase-3 subunit gamma/tau
MAIIKLNFLQQAIELSLEDNQLIKKKLVDSHYPIRLKKIIPLSNIVVTSEAKLVIETSSKPATAVEKLAPKVVEKPLAAPIVQPIATVITSTEIPGAKKNLLAVLQQKYGSQYDIEEVKESLPLSMELLRKCWDEYAVYLESIAKHASFGTFKIAQLTIENETHFTVSVNALTAQKFVEQERMNFLEKTWEAFQNRAIQFDILVDAGEKEDVPLHMRLNSKQKYERIAEQYPMVAALKSRLNLEIYF